MLGIEELYGKYEHGLLRFAKSLTGDKNEAEDLVQEIFMKAIINIGLISTLPDYKVKSWLFKAVKNCFIDKKRSGRYEVLTGFDDPSYEFFNEPDMDINIMTCEMLSYLPEKSRDIVFKRYFLDMNSEEIGKALSMPSSTVRYHLSSAIKSLKKKYINI